MRLRPVDPMQAWLAMGFLALTLLTAGCAHNRYLEIQCIDRPRPEAVEGPVIIDGDSVIYYDSRNKLMKKSKETCGVKAVE